MAYIGKKPEDLIRGNATYNAFTGDGSTTTFDVTNLLPDGGSFDVQVFVDNVRQEAGSSKSYTIGQDGSGDLKRVTFNVAPDDGAEIYVINPGRETSIISVADNTITAAKLQDDAVTTAKILDSNVTTAKIAADAITGAKLADDAVNSEHLVDGSVDNVHLAGSIANDKLSNSSITINGTAVSLGGSVTAGTDWQAVVTADGSTQLAAVAGKGYFLDTNAGVIEVTLPSNPSRGDTFVFADYGNTFGNNRVVIDAAGKLIDSTVGGRPPGSDYVMESNGQVVELVFVDDTTGYLIKQNSTPSDLDADGGPQFTSATGGTITTSGDFRIHTFTGDGCFVVSKVGNPSDCGGGGNQVSYMVVAGGGGSGGDRAGGGGAGGFREGKASNDTYTASPLNAPSGLTISAQTYPITVGGGGAGDCYAGSSGTNCATNGSNSVFSTITSAGGGKGASGLGGGANENGTAGGSGGGGAAGSGAPSTGGAGNTPPVSPPQGSAGGSVPSGPSGGGGGGAGTAGANTTSAPGGNGGNGVASVITGSSANYAGGGGGGASNPGTGGTGGSGGGGDGAPAPNSDSPAASRAGTANTGGGAGAGNQTSGGNEGAAGGKGIVVIRYKFQ